MLHYTNEMGVLQTEFDKAEQEAARHDAIWQNICSTAASKTLLIGQINMYFHSLSTFVPSDPNAKQAFQSIVAKLIIINLYKRINDLEQFKEINFS